jgi:hypothetical protein
MSKDILKAHGDTIELASQEGEVTVRVAYLSVIEGFTY